MEAEFRLHQELRAADLERQGRAPAEAARRARLEFGSMERYKREGRHARGLRLVDTFGMSWLGVKLGVRILVRYPGLTIVGGLAMAFAIWVGAGAFEMVRQALAPSLPLPQGARIFGLQLRDTETSRPQRHALLQFADWRAELQTVQDLGAFRRVERNLVAADGASMPTPLAEIRASAFRVTRVPPLLGRVLIAADELPAAPPVAVIGSRWGPAERCPSGSRRTCRRRPSSMLSS